MPESLILSFSQVANHFTTHFNNFQEDRFQKHPERADNLIHIAPKATPGSKLISNLYPRSVLYDYANGTGALDPYVYFQSDQTASLQSNGCQTIRTAPHIPVNSYQENINQAFMTMNDSSKVDNVRTDYWSDFSRVTYKPSSLITHPEFNYDPESAMGVGKNISTNKFIGHKLGIDTFQDIDEFKYSTDEQIRKMFEEAHNVSQVNIVVELDSAWSGVCSETLKYTIDDQLNGKGSKVLVWSLQHEGDYLKSNNNKARLDRIRALLELGNGEAGGFIPLNIDFKNPFTNNKSNIWESTAFLSIPFDFFNSIKETDISQILHQLTDGGLRKYINDVRLSWDDKVLDLGCKDLFTPSKKSNLYPYVFSRSVVNDFHCDAKHQEKFSDFENLAKNGTPKMFLQNYTSRYSYKFFDALPAAFEEANIESASLGVTNSLKNNFSDMYDFVSRYCQTDERESFKDELENLREAYTFGFEPSDEENDD